jgi:hypothetical protein
MAKSVRAQTGLTIETRGFAGLIRALGKADVELALDIKSRLRIAGGSVANEARKLAPSQKIADTIKVRVTAANVQVVAGNAATPEAALLELGNHGGSKSANSRGRQVFRHPVFGRDGWVEQPMKPFLLPALEAKAPYVETLILAALEEAAAHICFDFEGE